MTKPSPEFSIFPTMSPHHWFLQLYVLSLSLPLPSSIFFKHTFFTQPLACCSFPQISKKPPAFLRVLCNDFLSKTAYPKFPILLLDLFIFSYYLTIMKCLLDICITLSASPTRISVFLWQEFSPVFISVIYSYLN